MAGTAVADTVGGLVGVGTANTLGILFAAVLAAVTWNLATWWWGYRRHPRTRSSGGSWGPVSRSVVSAPCAGEGSTGGVRLG
jgi:PiT family inorganic phosphate transporter